MNIRFLAYMFIAIVSAATSILCLIEILASNSAGRSVVPYIPTAFWFSSGVGILAAYKAANSGRKPKEQEHYKDL